MGTYAVAPLISEVPESYEKLNGEASCLRFILMHVLKSSIENSIQNNVFIWGTVKKMF